MRKIVVGVVVTVGLILAIALGFTLYAQFALDYSLENLRIALEEAGGGTPSDIRARLLSKTRIENLVLQEMGRQDADLENVALLEHAARSIRDAVEQSGYARAGAYLAEVLRERAPQRNPVLRTIDAVYHFFDRMIRSGREFWDYVARRLQGKAALQPLEGTGILLLGEAERMESQWNLKEAEQYYREFLERYRDRQEGGLVRLSLAHVLMKQRKLNEAEAMLREIRREFPGSREEGLALNFMERIRSVRREEARIPKLEAWIQEKPERFFTEEGGPELVLVYLATYQVDRALRVLKNLEAAPDPRLRTKALFYQGWIHKWQGDFSEGEEIFEKLAGTPDVEKPLAVATEAELAEVHYEQKEYDQAVSRYQELERKAAQESWRALSEMEQSHIYLFGLQRAQEVRDRLQRVEQVSVERSPLFELARARLQEAAEQSLGIQALAALSEGRVSESEQLFQAHLEKSPRDGVAWSGLASVYVLQGSLKKAIGAAERGFGFQRNEYTAAVLGYVYEKAERFEEAERYYRVAVQIAPAYELARFNLARVHLQRGRYKEADELLQKLEEETRGSNSLARAKILNNRGFVLWTLGRREEAVRRFEEALKVAPGLPEARHNLNLTKAQ